MSTEVRYDFIPPDQLAQEVVERKGLGHPDTLADGLVEATELEYARYCLENFGAIPHHNLDKASIIGGLCVQQYGGSDFSLPVKLLFMGRASKSFGGETIPLAEIQDQVSRGYLERVLPHLDTANPNIFQTQSLTSTRSTRPFWFAPRSIDDLPEYAGAAPLANDTAAMISYWPLTTTEKLALDLEGYFYEDDEQGLPHPRFEYLGQDIKVMCVRNAGLISATLCVPQVSTETPNEKVYEDRQQALQAELNKYAKELVADSVDVDVQINTQSRGSNSRPYLVTGGSCTDFGEEGAVGRGNKTHGIISSFRPNTMEAPHGKNPTYFVGKVLGYQADLISRRVSERLGVKCQVVLQANMGDNLFDPSRVSVSTNGEVAKSDIDSVVAECLSLGRTTTEMIIDTQHYLPRTNAWSGHD